MFGSKDFILNFEQNEHAGSFDIKRLLQQTKQISQIIAYIWLDEGNQYVCKELDARFRDVDKLTKLLFSRESDPEYDLLKMVFEHHSNAILPIFNDAELEIYDFKILLNQYEGKITDAPPDSGKFLTMWIPYPPRPQISSQRNQPDGPIAPIYKEDLEQWVQDHSDQPPYRASNPYIPTTCS
ncbi:MAG: hypothetical protein F6K42_09845 [Leptolyngbya sp. SIO1D8]|nr:hypothetical protein [Leptolyngbya sp. SIO1D8]